MDNKERTLKRRIMKACHTQTKLIIAIENDKEQKWSAYNKMDIHYRYQLALCMSYYQNLMKGES